MIYYRHKGRHQYIGKPKAKRSATKLGKQKREGSQSKRKTNILANPKDIPQGQREFQHKSIPLMGKRKCMLGDYGDQKGECQNSQRGGTDVQVNPRNHKTQENLPGSAQT